MASELLVIDADILITAHRNTYRFSFCPGFWESVLRDFRLAGRAISIIPVRDELTKGSDLLADWAKNDVPDGFFASVEGCQSKFQEVVEYVNGSTQFQEPAKSKFLDGADPQLVAFAMNSDKNAIIVTNEVSALESRNSVKLPDIALAFGINCMSGPDFIEKIGARFTLED